jgi:hypothetical protein
MQMVMSIKKMIQRGVLRCGKNTVQIKDVQLAVKSPVRHLSEDAHQVWREHLFLAKTNSP